MGGKLGIASGEKEREWDGGGGPGDIYQGGTSGTTCVDVHDAPAPGMPVKPGGVDIFGNFFGNFSEKSLKKGKFWGDFSDRVKETSPRLGLARR